LDAVLNNPVPEPDIEAEFAAVTVTSPPSPPPLVLLSTLAPLVCMKLVTFSAMLPAFPGPDVATEIVPPSPMASVGVETLICPAFPVLEDVLNNPLGWLPLPEIKIDSPAVAATLPPCPEPLVLLTTCDPPARLKEFAFSKM